MQIEELETVNSQIPHTKRFNKRDTEEILVQVLKDYVTHVTLRVYSIIEVFTFSCGRKFTYTGFSEKSVPVIMVIISESSPNYSSSCFSDDYSEDDIDRNLPHFHFHWSLHHFHIPGL